MVDIADKGENRFMVCGTSGPRLVILILFTIEGSDTSHTSDDYIYCSRLFRVASECRTGLPGSAQTYTISAIREGRASNACNIMVGIVIYVWSETCIDICSVWSAGRQ